MKRLMFVSVFALLLLGSWSQSVSGLDRPFIVPENGENNGSSGDHPWGGDNNTPGNIPPTYKTNLLATPSTGIGTIDLILQIFHFKYFSTTAHVKTGRATVITTTTTTTTSGNTATVKTTNANNQ
jgi:hypothetical protein